MWVWRVLQVGVSGLGFWAFRMVEGCDANIVHYQKMCYR